MTYGTSHLLIGWGEVIFRRSVKKKYCCVRGGGGGGGGGGHYMKNKNIQGYVLSIQPDQQKRSQCKNAQKMQKIIKH